MRNLIEYIKKAETWEGPSNEYEACIWDEEVELIHELIRRGESALLIKLMDCIKKFTKHYIDAGYEYEHMEILNIIRCIDIACEHGEYKIADEIEHYLLNNYTQEQIDAIKRKKDTHDFGLLYQHERFEIEYYKKVEKELTSLEELRNKNIGDSVTLGRCIQKVCDDETNMCVSHRFLKPIEWIVLDKKDDRLMLMSKEIIIYYYIMDDEVMCWEPIWDTTAAYRGLNEYYFEIMFDKEEKSRIIEEQNRGKIYPLSLHEYIRLEAIMAKYPAYDTELVRQERWSNYRNNTWLLSSLYDEGKGVIGAFINEKGEIRKDYMNEEEGIRPVIWYSLK